MESRRRRNVHARVYEQSGWRCEMPVCLAETRDIDPALKGYDDPWAPSIDHVEPLGAGGRDAPSNMRAAHRACNEHAGKQRGGTIGEQYPDLLKRVLELIRVD
jgi:hypothetical protein